MCAELSIMASSLTEGERCCLQIHDELRICLPGTGALEDKIQSLLGFDPCGFKLDMTCASCTIAPPCLPCELVISSCTSGRVAPWPALTNAASLRQPFGSLCAFM